MALYVNGKPVNDSLMHSYSMNEQVVGKWTDGKPIYERTYNPTVTSADQTFAHGISNLGTVVSITGMCTYNNQVEWLSLPYVSTTSSYCITLSNVTSTTFRLIRGNGFSSIQNLYVTMQYTKTTD